MFPRKYKKISKFKRFLLKLLNVYAFDNESLNLVNPNYNNNSGNNFILNDKSIILSEGYLNLDRKIKKLDIYFRYAPNNKLWNSTDRWKRIVPNINKEELILTCLQSLITSINKFSEKNNLKITLNLISDKSNDKFDNKIEELSNLKNIELKFYK